MDTPKKRTLTAEQKAKMQEGRKKAMESRKALKEEEKKATKKEKELTKKTEKSKKEIQKVRNLELELEALQQQKDRIQSLKQTHENRAKFRNKMKDFKQEEQMIEMAIKEPSQPTGDFFEPDEITDEEIFNKKANELAETATNPETKKIFKSVVGKFDNQKSITHNLSSMIEDLKDLIKNNAKQAKEVEKVVKEIVAEKPIEAMTIVEMKQEQKYKSQLSSLMRLR